VTGSPGKGVNGEGRAVSGGDTARAADATDDADPTDAALVDGEAAMAALAESLVRTLPRRSIVTLSGDLGAGKSVIARAMLRALGHAGPVPSPTYAIVESYTVADRRVAHLDLYRLLDPGELHDIGFDDVVAGHDLLLIEWPEQGGTLLPTADVAVYIEHAGGDVRRVRITRHGQADDR